MINNIELIFCKVEILKDQDYWMEQFEKFANKCVLNNIDKIIITKLDNKKSNYGIIHYKNNKLRGSIGFDSVDMILGYIKGVNSYR